MLTTPMQQTMSETIFEKVLNILNQDRGQKRRAHKQGILDSRKQEATAKAKEGRTEWPDIMKASFAGDIKCLNTLLKDELQLDVNWQDSNGVTPLVLASREGHTEMVKILLDKDAQVNKQDKSSSSALMMASKQGHTEVVQLLLDHGAHVNIYMQDEDGVSALMMACENGKTELAELLIKSGADVDMVSHTGESALTMACSKGHLEVVKLLVNNGAQMETNIKHRTPLMLASGYNHYEVIKYLLDKGAKVNTQNSENGDSALMCACTTLSVLQDDNDAETNTKCCFNAS